MKTKKKNRFLTVVFRAFVMALIALGMINPRVVEAEKKEIAISNNPSVYASTNDIGVSTLSVVTSMSTDNQLRVATSSNTTNTAVIPVALKSDSTTRIFTPPFLDFEDHYWYLNDSSIDSVTTTYETTNESSTCEVESDPEPEHAVEEDDIAAKNAAVNITLRELDQMKANGEEIETYQIIYAICNYLVGEEGWKVGGCSGVCGNAGAEDNYKTKVDNPFNRDYHGMFQWNSTKEGGYWWNDISAWMKENGYPIDSWEGQVKAMVHCPNHGLLSAEKLETLKNLDDPEQAAELFAIWYEGCVGGSDYPIYYNTGYCYQDLGLRRSEARIAYDLYTSGSTEYTGQRAYYG